MYLDTSNESAAPAKRESVPQHASQRAPKPTMEELAFRPGETLGESLVRVTALLACTARGRLNLSGDADPEDLHIVRTAIKRWRALLAAFKPLLDADTYEAEQSRLRRAMRVLGGSRDRDVMLQTLEAVAVRAASAEARESVETVRARLAHSAPGEDAHQLWASEVEVLRLIERSAGAMAQIRCPGDKRDAALPGLAETARGAAKRMKRAVRGGGIEEHHRWRITLKRLGYQFEWMAPVWPKRLGKLARRIEKLEKRLGALHDLAVLEEAIERRPSALGGEQAVRPALDGIELWSRKLRRSSRNRGQKLAGKMKAKFWRAFEKHWVRWRRRANGGRELG